MKTIGKMKFESYGNMLRKGSIKIDENLLWFNYEKMGHAEVISVAFLALADFIAKENTLPKPWNLLDS